MNNLKYGDTVRFSSSSATRNCATPSYLGIYNTDSQYLVLGNRIGYDPVITATSFDWELMPPEGKSEGDIINSGDPFYLFNLHFKQYLTDDHTASGFDGFEGCFGLARTHSGINGTGKARANQYQLTTSDSRHISDGATSLTLSCFTEFESLPGASLTIQANDAGMHIVWDSPKHIAPTFTVDVLSTNDVQTKSSLSKKRRTLLRSRSSH